MTDLSPPTFADSLQDFFEALPIGLYRTSLDGDLLYVNPGLAEILGYSDTTALLAMRVADLCPIAEEREQWIAQMNSEGRARNFKLRLKRQDGQLTWVQDNARAVYGPDGQLAYYEGIMEEISAQIAAQKALERAEVMREVAQIVNASLDRDEVLRRSLSQLRRVLTFDTGSVYIYNEGIRPEIVISAGYADERLTMRQGAKLLAHSPILQRMAQDHQPVLSGDVNHLPGWLWIPGAEHVRSFMAVPLIAREQMIGALMIDSSQPHFFDQTHLQIVHTLAQNVAIAVENARLFEVVQRSLADQSALLAATTAVSSTLDLPTALTQLAEQIGQALRVSQVHIYRWNQFQQTATRLACYIPRDDPVQSPPTSPETLLFHERLPWLTWDQPMQRQIDDHYLPMFLQKRLGQTDMSSVLYVPFGVQNTVVGFAELLESNPGRKFTGAEIALAKGMAQQAAISFENARLYQAEAQRRREAETLYQLASYLTGTLDLDDVFTRAVEAVRQNVAELQGCAISLLEEDGETLCVRINWAREEQYIYNPTGTRVRVKDTYVSAAVLETCQPVIIEDLQQAVVKSPRLRDGLNRGIRALLYLPLLAHGQPIGILHLNVFHLPRRFLPEEITLCQGVANQTAVAVENARLFAAERRQLRLSQTLQEVGALLTSQISLAELFDHIFTLLAQVVGYDSVSVQLIEGNRTYLAAGRGFPDFDLAAEIISKIAAPTLQERWGVVQQGYVVIPDTHDDPRWDVSLGNEYIRSWIGAALVVKGRMLGTLNVDNATSYAYNSQLGETVAAFANQAAVAIENARLYEETRQRVNELAVLHQVALATTAVANADDLLRQTTEMVARSVYHDTFGFLLVDSETGQLIPHPSYHGLGDNPVNQTVPLTRGMVGYVAQTGRPLLARDVSQEPRYYQVTASTRSEVTVPLLLRHQVIGVINVESPRLNAFGESDLHFLTTLAGQVSIALERAELYESLQRHTGHLAQEVGQRTAELRAERDRTQAILDSAGEGIFFADRQGIVLYVNPAMTRLTGYSAPEMLGQTLRLWQPHGDMMDNAYEPLWAALTEGQSWSGELISRRKDSVLYDVSLTIAPIFGGGGGLTGFVGIQSDISRLKEVERLKSQFVSNVSHELRTPLTNIKTYVTLLQRGKAERRDHYLDVLGHETERLTRLIQDLLDLSRLESDLNTLKLQPVDLIRLIPDLCWSFSAKAEMRHTSLHLNLPGELPAALAEPSQLESVIINLVGNALMYTPEGSKVSVSAGVGERDGRQMVWFKVADNGPGIPREDLPRLFDRFYRGKMSQERNIPGTGLGLAICKEIINRHQGAIDIDSRPGEGVTFTVWLQVALSGA
jgi:PAS domain S-box-containing protein